MPSPYFILIQFSADIASIGYPRTSSFALDKIRITVSYVLHCVEQRFVFHILGHYFFVAVVT